MHAILGSLALAATLLYTADACGMVVHMTIANRAFQHFYDPGQYPEYRALISDNYGALMAGAPYPDYLYECGTNHDDGEFTHWSPFQAVAADYMRQTYAKPWNATASRLAAFMFGIVSHYIADINWHGLAQVPNNYGMIETMGGIDFNCTGLCGTAHTAADTGGEFIAAWAFNLTYDAPWDWYIPVNDLVSIYAMANRTVNASAIEECGAIFYAGSVAIRYLGALIEPIMIDGAPTFAENFIDLPLGGIDDMAIWTTRMWTRWEAWLEEGPPPNIPGGGWMAPKSSKTSGIHRHRTPEALRLKRLLLLGADVVRDAVKKTVEADGSVRLEFDLNHASYAEDMPEWTRSLSPAELHAYRVAASMLDVLVADESMSLDRNTVDSQSTQSWTRDSSEYTATPAAKSAALAARLVSWLHGTGRGASVEAIRAKLTLSLQNPASDRDVAKVILLQALAHLRSKQHANQQKEAQQHLRGQAHAASSVAADPVAVWASTTDLEYVGSSVAVGDFDKDGKDDIVMGAMGHTINVGVPGTLPQSGGFYVRYGSEPTPSGGVQPLPAHATLGSQVYTRLGWSSCVLDFNLDGVDDLAISAPSQGWNWTVTSPPYQADFYYWGAVHIFFGHAGAGLASTTPDVSILTSNNETHMGMHLNCKDIDGDGQLELIVGSPMARRNGDASTPYSAETGRLDVFHANAAYKTGTTLDLDANAMYTGNGTTVDAWFGYHTDVLHNVTLPAAEFLSYATAQRSDACLQGLSEATLTANVTVSLLFVGAPGDRDAPSYNAVGRLFAFALPSAKTPSQITEAFHCMSDTASGATPLPSPLFTIVGEATLNTLGSLVSSKLAAGFAVGYPISRSMPFLALGVPDTAGPHAQNASASGAVLLLPLSRLPRGDVRWTNISTSSRSLLIAQSSDSRFGYRVAFQDVNADGYDDLIVAAPMYSTFTWASGDRELGAVFVYSGGQKLPAGTVNQAENAAAWSTIGSEHNGRLCAVFDTAVIVGGSTQLVCGAQKASLTGAEMSGAVYAFNVTW